MFHLSISNAFRICCAAALCLAVVLTAQQQKRDGFKDTPVLPNQKWHVHDPDRPYPPAVTPGSTPGAPPSDAIILFDGKDLSKWAQHGRNNGGKDVAPAWKVENGYFEIAPRSGDMFTREKFGDCQLHIEWMEPATVKGFSQERGNSGVYMMGRYETQVLDSYQQPTYADGQAGAIYGQWPPLVNPIRKPGEWNVYDILFEAPRFEGDKVARPAYFTTLFNGVMVHNHKESLGATVYREVAKYTRHDAEEPLLLQDHGHVVRYRNIWIRRTAGYDQPEK